MGTTVRGSDRNRSIPIPISMMHAACRASTATTGMTRRFVNNVKVRRLDRYHRLCARLVLEFLTSSEGMIRVFGGVGDATMRGWMGIHGTTTRTGRRVYSGLGFGVTDGWRRVGWVYSLSVVSRRLAFRDGGNGARGVANGMIRTRGLDRDQIDRSGPPTYPPH